MVSLRADVLCASFGRLEVVNVATSGLLRERVLIELEEEHDKVDGSTFGLR